MPSSGRRAQLAALVKTSRNLSFGAFRHNRALDAVAGGGLLKAAATETYSYQKPPISFLIVSAPNAVAKPARPLHMPASQRRAGRRDKRETQPERTAASVTLVRFEPNMPANGAASA